MVLAGALLSGIRGRNGLLFTTSHEGESPHVLLPEAATYLIRSPHRRDRPDGTGGDPGGGFMLGFFSLKKSLHVLVVYRTIVVLWCSLYGLQVSTMPSDVTSR